LLFGSEPSRLASGETNPLALIPVTVVLLIVVVALPLLLAVVRRPLIIADHYALSVRPGIGRTLLLPWAGIVEITAVTVLEVPLLLVRLSAGRGRIGDRPTWHDQRVLRSGGGEAAAGYDLAVRMDEFVGEPAAQLTALAAWAPDQVRVTNRS
jgi:hypothetical protein